MYPNYHLTIFPSVRLLLLILLPSFILSNDFNPYTSAPALTLSLPTKTSVLLLTIDQPHPSTSPTSTPTTRTLAYASSIVHLTGSTNDVIELHSVLSSLPTDVSPAVLSRLVSRVLYERRFFPYGCHIVVGGWENGEGKVWNYDGIGR